LLPLLVTLVVALPEGALQRQLSADTELARSSGAAANAARDVEDARLNAAGEIRRRLSTGSGTGNAIAKTQNSLRAAESRLLALAGPQRRALDQARRVTVITNGLFGYYARAIAEIRSGHRNAATAILNSSAYLDRITELNTVTAAFIGDASQLQDRQFASLQRLRDISTLLLLLACAALATSSALLLYFSARAVRAIRDIRDKGERYQRHEPVGPPSTRHDEIGNLDAAFYAFIASIDLAERELARYRLLADVTTDPFLFVDRATRTIIEANPAALATYGYARADFVGMPVGIIRPPGLPAELGLQGRIDTSANVSYEAIHQRSNGSRFPVEVHAGTVTSEGRPTIACTIRDISERRRTAEQLALALGEAVRGTESAVRHNAELEAANAELESFSYSVSHDLRAPVRAINGFATALQMDYGHVLDDEGRRLLAVVNDEAVRMGELIDDLLAFSRFGRARMERAFVDMDGLARDVVAEQLRWTGDTRATIEISPLPGTYGDLHLLRQVWANLIGNALKYSSKCERPHLRISGTVTDGAATYAVHDNGVGFDMAYAQKLFGLFQRLHRNDEFSGTGVGLAIVKRIVSRHDGTVHAESSPSAGTTFSFTLPAAELTASASASVFAGTSHS
jgi:PAS domain S-box-containing protein